MPYAEYNCDLCGSDIAIEVPYSRHYTHEQQPLHICCSCGFVHARNRRSPEEVARAWSEEVYGEVYTAKIPAVLARHTYMAQFAEDTLGLDGKTIFDIGGGEGQFLEILRDSYGGKIVTVEPSPVNCHTLRNAGFDCFEGTIEQFAETDRNVNADLTTILWTLENCVSCRDMLSIAHEQVCDGGHIMVATGSRILVPFKKTLRDYYGPNPVDLHSFHFSANTLQGLLAVSGFKPVAINRYRDTDYLVVIGEKRPAGDTIAWQGDDYLDVHHFFERWHTESMYHQGGEGPRFGEGGENRK